MRVAWRSNARTTAAATSLRGSGSEALLHALTRGYCTCYYCTESRTPLAAASAAAVSTILAPASIGRFPFPVDFFQFSRHLVLMSVESLMRIARWTIEYFSSCSSRKRCCNRLEGGGGHQLVGV